MVVLPFKTTINTRLIQLTRSLTLQPHLSLNSSTHFQLSFKQHHNTTIKMGFSTRVALVGSVLAAAANASPNYYGAPANTTGGVVYTTEVVTSLTTYCPAATTLTYGDKTYTVTEATTLTITDCPCTVSKPVYTKTYAPPASSSAASTCPEECYDAYNKCRTGPDANMATCAAEYASCLGFNPFGDDGSLVTPTACSSKTAYTQPPVYTTEVVTAITTYCPEATTLTYNNITYPVTEPTTLTISNCPCTISKPLTTYPVPTHSAPASTCPEECATAYNNCRGAANANMATCAAEYAGCLGYSPFGPDGSLITPTACSAAPTGGKTTYPVGTATQSVPAVTTTPAVVPGSGAERVAPAGLLLALGAIALF
ncbi:hypothetical protein EDB81DRAFT_813472 [Dactylonectria macrodidyma]|uniref:Cell wall glycoprotein n=1 Tax=Dactylonectria macrodidyma TaxID=307937 RepID=A0A9P9DPR0_9HYPO|nr:hypothetical protein EDB81DRAFT_813472 [Dactylonectria macrodidyma]